MTQQKTEPAEKEIAEDPHCQVPYNPIRKGAEGPGGFTVYPDGTGPMWHGDYHDWPLNRF